MTITDTIGISNINVGDPGWKDLIGSFAAGKANGTNIPTWADMGNGFYAWRFDNNKTASIQIWFHTSHDIDYTKKALCHVHWCPTTNLVGNVVWKIDYLISKGHSQGANMAAALSGSITLIGTALGNTGEHIITEVTSANGISLIEPDCLILVTVTRLGSDVNDTYPDPVFGFTLDFHYYSQNGSTLGNKPNFGNLILPTPV